MNSEEGSSVPLKSVEFTGFLAGIAAKKLVMGDSLRLESLEADYTRRIVIATIASKTRHVPFERCDVLVPSEEPTATTATEEKKKNGKRSQPNAA
jgi:hypothetical protein